MGEKRNEIFDHGNLPELTGQAGTRLPVGRQGESQKLKTKEEI
jgi:hypothetical protein